MACCFVSRTYTVHRMMPCRVYLAAAFPGRPGAMSMRGRGRGRIPIGGPPGVPPGMPPTGEFPQGIDER